ncbi:hypothetical protein BDB01DRAFT_361724 [Pilobolus umbonatus]|nr:hypothetical protein BDB01DRAFT_361724 [Pilobolus umbonatus]
MPPNRRNIRPQGCCLRITTFIVKLFIGFCIVFTVGDLVEFYRPKRIKSPVFVPKLLSPPPPQDRMLYASTRIPVKLSIESPSFVLNVEKDATVPDHIYHLDQHYKMTDDQHGSNSVTSMTQLSQSSTTNYFTVNSLSGLALAKTDPGYVLTSSIALESSTCEYKNTITSHSVNSTCGVSTTMQVDGSTCTFVARAYPSSCVLSSSLAYQDSICILTTRSKPYLSTTSDKTSNKITLTIKGDSCMLSTHSDRPTLQRNKPVVLTSQTVPKVTDPVTTNSILVKDNQHNLSENAWKWVTPNVVAFASMVVLSLIAFFFGY